MCQGYSLYIVCSLFGAEVEWGERVVVRQAVEERLSPDS